MSTDKFTQLEAFIGEKMEEYRIPGVAFGVWHNGEKKAAGLGVTNRDHPLPVTADTLFQIGSISKTFTALLVMQFVEAGDIDLDAPIRTYLPDFRVADEATSAQATVRHLLTHSAGWVGDLFVDTGEGEDALSGYMALMADLEQLAPLNTAYSYNNAGFYLLGHLLEVLSGESYDDLLRERIFKPLEMEHTYLTAGEVMTHRFAVGHQVGEEGAAVARPWPLPRAVRPAGGIITCVPDLLRYARFQMGDGGTEAGEKLLSVENMITMHTPQLSIWQDKEQVALSWFVEQVGELETWYHGGGTTGQVTLLLLVPEQAFALALFTNADRGGSLNRDVSEWGLETFLGTPWPRLKPQNASAEELAQYAGSYSRPYADLDLTLEEGQLMGKMTIKQGFPDKNDPPAPSPPPFPIDLAEPDQLLVTEGPFKDTRADVIRLPNGDIGWIRIGRLYRRVSE